MSYLEKVINDRIEELKQENNEILDKLKTKIIENKISNDYFDLEECYLDIDSNETRINELELLKKGLGLVPVEDKKETKVIA